MKIRRARAAGALAAAALLALSATACNPGRPPAATVAGVDISGAHVDELIAALGEASDTALQASRGQGDDTYRSAWAADVLQVLVERVTLSQLAQEYGVIAAAGDRDTARDELEAQLTGPGEEGVGQAALAGMDEATREWLLDISADEVALRQQLAVDPDLLQRIAADHPRAFVQHCYRIAYLTPATYEEFASRLGAGEDFGAVALELAPEGTIPEGASIGCPPDVVFAATVNTSLVEAAQQVPDGGIAGPVPATDENGNPTENAYVLEVGPPAPAAVADVIDALAQAQDDNLARAIVRELLLARLGTAEVSVDPSFGRWDPERLAVSAGTGPSGPTTLPEIVPEGTAPAPQEAPPG